MNVIKNMMTLAHNLADVSLPKGQRDVDSAMMLWSAVYSLGFSASQSQRVVLTIMSVASRPEAEGFRREAAVALEQGKNRFPDRFFRARILSALYKFSGRAQQAIDFIDSSGRKEASILVVKADALRERGRRDASIDLSSRIIAKYAKKDRITIEEREVCLDKASFMPKGNRRGRRRYDAGRDPAGRFPFPRKPC